MDKAPQTFMSRVAGKLLHGSHGSRSDTDVEQAATSSAPQGHSGGAM